MIESLMASSYMGLYSSWLPGARKIKIIPQNYPKIGKKLPKKEAFSPQIPYPSEKSF